MSEPQLKDFLYYLVENIVNRPEVIEIREDQDQNGFSTLTLTVAPEDMGKIIGKGGRIIHALRDLLKVYGVKNNVKANLLLTE